jgi:hypothetical protein
LCGLAYVEIADWEGELLQISGNLFLCRYGAARQSESEEVDNKRFKRPPFLLYQHLSFERLTPSAAVGAAYS